MTSLPRNIVRQSLVYIVAVFFSLTVAMICLVEILYVAQVRPAIESNQSEQRKNLATYLDDVVFSSQFAILKPGQRGNADAGAVLNPIFHWEPARFVKRVNAASLVSAKDREYILRLRGDWMIKHEKAKRMRTDLRFFSALPRYDYWDIETASPIEDLARSARFVPPPELPIPEVSDILAVAKIRLMMGAVNGDANQALLEVRALARLLLTTENLQLTLAGLAVIDVEREAYRYFVDEEGFNPASWLPADRNVTRRSYREIAATRGYLQLWTDTDLLKKVFLSDVLPVGFCAAVNEALPQAYALAPLLQPHLPLERDLRPAYAEFEKVFKRAKQSCRIEYLTALVQAGNFDVTIPGLLLIDRLPFTRKIFGLRVSALGFEGFAAYDALAAYGGAKTE